jgi:hypothetical protein
MEKQLKEVSGNIGDIFDVEIVRVDDGLSSIYRKEDVVIILNKLKEVVCKVIESSNDTLNADKSNGVVDRKAIVQELAENLRENVTDLFKGYDFDEAIELDLYNREIEVRFNERDFVSHLETGIKDWAEEQIDKLEEQEA